jgi:hypothetical protein
VISRCTGTAASTFGGGGGTKLFCSQALKPKDANMTTAARDAVKACCKCLGFISGPRFKLLQIKAVVRRRLSRSMDINNLLAVEPETENDIADRKLFCRLFEISLRLQRRLRRQQEGFV